MALKLKDITLSHVYEYVNTGKIEDESANTDPAIVEYLDLLDKCRSMHLRIDEFGHKDAIVAHLMKVEKLSRYLASNIYNDAMEYFYADKQISSDAWRNIIAQYMQKNYLLAIQLAKDPKDIGTANKILIDMAKTLRLDQPDPVEVDQKAYTQPFKMYSVDAKFLGIPEINRTDLKNLIDGLPEISEREKLRLHQEANTLPVKLFLDEHEDPRKS
ncbi:hypothetical protein ACFFVB_18435 [Formosa undariae]|uniref:DUF4296 domain-containing protein n=1 Tax=Formosa undariae TaxID=1325436 RepID=A0ABV5F6K4_9FLAO